MKANNFGITAAACAALALILDSRAASQAASAGIEICIRTVIPSLFPFFLLSGYLTGNLQGGAWIAKLFRSPKNTGGILLSGFLGGYPMGAKLTAQQFHSGGISKEEADRLIMFCSQAGPSFLFGITAGQLGKTRLVWLLWAVTLLSALSVAWLIPGDSEKDAKNIPAKKVTLTEAMNTSVRAMAAVCGWVVVFNVLMFFLNSRFLRFLPGEIQVLFCGLLELTNGCLMLSSVENLQIRFLLAAVMVNFGGVCVWMQTASVAEGISLKRYLWGKLLQTGFALLYSLVFYGHTWLMIPLLFLICGRILLKSGKSSSIPVKYGV